MIYSSGLTGGRYWSSIYYIECIGDNYTRGVYFIYTKGNTNKVYIVVTKCYPFYIYKIVFNNLMDMDIFI